MIGSTKIIKEISLEEFEEIIFNNPIIIGSHALDHLSTWQRKLFKEDELINILTKEKPCGIGLQINGRYSTFFKRKWGFMRIIFEVKGEWIEIITFTNPETMPNLKRL